jgi:hypothetical protein
MSDKLQLTKPFVMQVQALPANSHNITTTSMPAAVRPQLAKVRTHNIDT